MVVSTGCDEAGRDQRDACAGGAHLPLGDSFEDELLPGLLHHRATELFETGNMRNRRYQKVWRMLKCHYKENERLCGRYSVTS